MARIIAIANQKGGVGKTTTAVNLSSALALMGRKVLVVDVDPQGNATSGLGIDKNSVEATLYDVFLGACSLSSVIVNTEQSSVSAYLWVAPANNDLVGAEVELTSMPGRETILRRQLEPLRSQFDYIFIDCPPSLGQLTVNALVAADTLLVPLQCEYYALEGISALMQTVKLARQQLNPNLGLEGVVLTMFDNRTNLSRQVASEARVFFGHSVFETVVPRNVRLSESPSFGKPIFYYDNESVGAAAYHALAAELERRQEERAPAVLQSTPASEDEDKERLVANRDF
jgi:chromosome partitioning protein